MATGTASLDFGTNGAEASVAVTGQASILAGSSIEAYMMGDSTASHSVDEHIYEDLKITCGNIVAGTGFTIYAECKTGSTHGIFTVHWVWV